MDDIVKHWGVDVRVNGERVLTIESNCLSGIEDIAKYKDAVVACAHHLLAFIGEPQTAEIVRLRALLRRYRNETPLGHQPHMIAGEVDAALADEQITKQEE